VQSDFGNVDAVHFDLAFGSLDQAEQCESQGRLAGPSPSHDPNLQCSEDGSDQGWPNYGPPTSLMRPAKHFAHFFQAPRFRLLTAAQQRWLLPVLNKSVNKWCDFIVIIVLQYILTTYFCIDYVNRTVSGPPVARQSRIWPSGQKFWPPLVQIVTCVILSLENVKTRHVGLRSPLLSRGGI